MVQGRASQHVIAGLRSPVLGRVEYEYGLLSCVVVYCCVAEPHIGLASIEWACVIGRSERVHRKMSRNMYAQL